ncbi:MAG: hypothetical protein M3501_10165, partial [Actinomycetota bacterium]|nr:hypothetical protein [Actinomycetota bacterium]
MAESGDGGNLTDEDFSSWEAAGFSSWEAARSWARLRSYARARLATGHQLSLATRRSWEADGSWLPHSWEADGSWLPEGVRGMDVGPTGVRLDVDGRRVEVVGRFQRTADGQRVVVPANRGAKRRDDLELLDAVGELLPGLEAVIPPAGRPRGGIIERAVRKVEGLISEGKSQHAA